jgi:hypothetical protein
MSETILQAEMTFLDKFQHVQDKCRQKMTFLQVGLKSYSDKEQIWQSSDL